MTFRLPPLSTLRIFEAAGRLLSFRLAAEQLHVTPSAVSHGIQSLEDWLGVALFVRGNRGLVLTKAGRAYHPYVSEALATLARGTESIPGRASKNAVSISAAPTFASRWLIPRLADFRQRHPGIAIVIDTEHRHVEFPLGGVDLAIRMGREPWPDLYSLRLFSETLFPVCSPAYRRKLPRRFLAADLPTFELLQVTTVSEDWAVWLAHANAPDVDLTRGLRFDTIFFAMEAAIEGLGVAIGRLPLVAPDLDRKRLVRLLAPELPSATSYWLVGAPETLRRPEVAIFRNWLKEQAASSKTS